ncbi:MAG: nucleotidyltransferase domain-containing protein [Oscillospiraceae bacterium]|nr:nucleotidyltransferase domain-containing protein [Oscillospiraceae bacterium]
MRTVTNTRKLDDNAETAAIDELITDKLLWENTGIKTKVIEELRRLAGDFGLTKLILFGSRAREDYRRESDIDLAVSGGDADGFRLAAEEETSTLLRYDILNLDLGLDYGILEEIRKNGKILYEKV